jgi:hypothetical protein
MESLIFQTSPIVHIGGNRFIGVPTILQYEKLKLIQVVQELRLGYMTQFELYHRDGTYLAKLKGARIFPTPAGEKAAVAVRHNPGLLVCTVGADTVVEVRYAGAAALRPVAELYAPDGTLIKCSDTSLRAVLDERHLEFNGVRLSDNTFKNCAIGILVRRSGELLIATSEPADALEVTVNKDALAAFTKTKALEDRANQEAQQ